MSLEVTALVLLAAAMHAGWNALIKVQGDRLAVMAVVTAAGSLLSLAALPFVDSPDPASWPLLGLTIVLHTGYHLFLPVAYDHGDLGQVYPIARGSAPLLVTIGAVLLAGEALEPMGLLGVVCLAAGVMALAFDKGAGLAKKPKAVLYALLTACFIASYTLVDGIGVRQAGSILGFAVWLTLGTGSSRSCWSASGRVPRCEGSCARTPLPGSWGAPCRRAPTGSSSGRWPRRPWPWSRRCARRASSSPP
jgi:drug/metabolite transporter (DMT)-like permease